MKKLTPLIVLGLFAVGVYLMKQGMDNTIKMTSPKKATTIKE